MIAKEYLVTMEFTFFVTAPSKREARKRALGLAQFDFNDCEVAVDPSCITGVRLAPKEVNR